MPVAVTYSHARDQVERLVERFARNLDAYKRADYKETMVRFWQDAEFDPDGWL